jgi:hypothetical protein
VINPRNFAVAHERVLMAEARKHQGKGTGCRRRMGGRERPATDGAERGAEMKRNEELVMVRRMPERVGNKRHECWNRLKALPPGNAPWINDEIDRILGELAWVAFDAGQRVRATLKELRAKRRMAKVVMDAALAAGESGAQS